ncbi:MAG: biliverdin-producing heme oxygenase [Labilithrix sp.]|nr:biliverdin-producing heme oxygenase [Labilithrix sp.]MCW5811189.1 biliverdin-producing heme oxygenase [Labilithrix sp.]
MAAASPASNGALVAALRAATNDARAELDRRLALRAETLTLPGYVSFLRASGSFVAPLEAAIACWLGVAADGLTRTSAIHADLVALGASEAPPASVPALRSIADAMGAAYVLEGSAVRGLFIARSVAKALGNAAPRRYLELRGDRTTDRWRDFVVTLETWGASATPAARTSACDTARATIAACASTFAAAVSLPPPAP